MGGAGGDGGNIGSGGGEGALARQMLEYMLPHIWDDARGLKYIDDTDGGVE